MPKVGLKLIIALTLVIAVTLAGIALNPLIAAGAKGQTENAASSSHVGSPGTGSKPNKGRLPGDSKWDPTTQKRGLTKE